MPARPAAAVRALAASALMCCLDAGVAHAQSFGGKAGAVWSDVVFDRDPAPADSRPAAALVAGGFLEIPVGDSPLSLQADVLFVQRRTEFADAPGSSAAFTDTLNYLEIPVVGRYRIVRRGVMQAAVEGGLGFSRLLTARERHAGGEDDIVAAIESRELSAIVGGSVDWQSITVGVRYLYGLSDIYRAEFFPARQRTLQVSVGYRVRIAH